MNRQKREHNEETRKRRKVKNDRNRQNPTKETSDDTMAGCHQRWTSEPNRASTTMEGGGRQGPGQDDVARRVVGKKSGLGKHKQARRQRLVSPPGSDLCARETADADADADAERGRVYVTYIRMRVGGGLFARRAQQRWVAEDRQGRGDRYDLDGKSRERTAQKQMPARGRAKKRDTATARDRRPPDGDRHADNPEGRIVCWAVGQAG